VIQIQIVLEHNEETGAANFQLNVLSREDATEYEWSWAREMEAMHFAIFQQMAKENNGKVVKVKARKK